MGYGTGTLKYWIMGLLFNPVNLYIYGSGLFWLFDLVSILGADDYWDLAVQLFFMQMGWPSSVEDFLVKLFVGAAVATVSWLIGSLRYASSRGWV